MTGRVVFIEPSIKSVKLMRANSKVGLPIVKLISVNVVNIGPCRGIHNDPVHSHCLQPPTCGGPTARVSISGYTPVVALNLGNVLNVNDCELS